jgi:hypothetical protein
MDELLQRLIAAYLVAPEHTGYERTLEEMLLERGRDLGLDEDAVGDRVARAIEAERRPRGGRHTPNSSYTVHAADSRGRPLSERWGPYKTLASAKTFARIGATEGRHGRVVMDGAGNVIRWYERGGERRL